MRGLYRTVLRWYPYDFRAAFAAEMLAAYDQAAAAGGSRAAELAGLLFALVPEWCAKFFTAKNVRGPSLPDVRMMRPAGVSRQAWFGGNPCSSDTWQ